MNLEVEKNRKIALNQINGLIDKIENGNEIDAIVISDFMEAIENVLDEELKSEFDIRANKIKEIFIDNALSITNESLDRAMNELTAMRSSILRVDLIRKNRAASLRNKHNIAKLEEKYKEEYELNEMKNILREEKTRLGERVYSDKDIDEMDYYYMLALVEMIKNPDKVHEQEEQPEEQDMSDELDNEIDELTNQINNLGIDPNIEVDEKDEEELKEVLEEEIDKSDAEKEEEIEDEVSESLETDIDLDEIEKEYLSVEKEIMTYIQVSVSKLRKLELHRERLIEEKKSISVDDPSRGDLEEEYDRQIKDTESNIRKIVNPDKEEQLRIRAEKDALYRLATMKIQKLELIIVNLKKENRKLEFLYNEMVYDGIKDYKEWYALKNKIEENNYKIRTLTGYIEKYELLKVELRKTEKVIDFNFDDDTKKKEGNGEKQPTPPVGPDPVPPIEPDPVPPVPPVSPVEPEPVPPVPPVDPIDQEKTGTTLDEIIFKVGGDYEFKGSSANRYMASKIKVFSKPEKNNLGNMYKLLSIPRRLFGIIPKAFMKAKGLFVSAETKETMKDIEERANNLTDEEMEILLHEYKGSTAQGMRVPKALNQILMSRIQAYIAEKVSVINLEISEKLKDIEYFSQIAETLDARLNEQYETVEEYNKVKQTADKAYAKTAILIKELISLQRKGNSLQSGNGLHSFEEEMNAVNSKMNYMGGRFSKTASWNPELRKELAELSHTIEYSTDPREIVDAYLDKQYLYIDNTAEKRSIRNLGSKVTVGELDYRPFVETLNYGRDPLISDLISTILIVSSITSLVQNIANNAKQQAMIDDINAQIKDANQAGIAHQNFVDKVRGSGETIEEGITADIHNNVGNAENFAERAINSKFDYALRGKDYVAADNLHHLETSNLTAQNLQEMTRLSNQYSSGAISHAEFVSELQALNQQSADLFNSYMNNYGQYLSDYAQTHPQFDLSSVLNMMKNAAQSPNASAELTELMSDIYSESFKVMDFKNIDYIDSIIETGSRVPDIATLAAVGAKLAHEDVRAISDKPSYDWDKDSKFAKLIEQIKEGKMFTVEEIDKEVDDMISRHR